MRFPQGLRRDARRLRRKGRGFTLSRKSCDMRRLSRYCPWFAALRWECGLRMGGAPDDEGMARGLGMSLEKWYRTAREIHLAGAGGYLYARSPRNRVLSEDTVAAENPQDQYELCYRSEQRELVSRALE